jgi:uncharacterized damage-inducible protein DinB
MKFCLTLSFVLFFYFAAYGQVKEVPFNFSEIWLRNSEYTIRIIESMPEEDFGFRPDSAMMSFAEQVIHMNKNLIFLQKYIFKEEKITSEFSSIDTAFSKTELIRNFKWRINAINEMLLKLSTDEWNNPVDFFDKNVEMKKLSIFLLMKDHLAHHRGQLIVYLRMKGIKPPEYKGW